MQTLSHLKHIGLWHCLLWCGFTDTRCGRVNWQVQQRACVMPICTFRRSCGHFREGTRWVIYCLLDVQLQDMLPRHVYLSFLVQRVLWGVVLSGQSCTDIQTWPADHHGLGCNAMGHAQSQVRKLFLMFACLRTCHGRCLRAARSV